MTNKSRVVLYTGVTNDLDRRVWEHQHRELKGFTKKYRVNCLVYHETYNRIDDPIAREKEIKGWRRSKKTRWWRRLIRDRLICQSSFSAVCEVPRRASPTRDDMVERR